MPGDDLAIAAGQRFDAPPSAPLIPAALSGGYIPSPPPAGRGLTASGLRIDTRTASGRKLVGRPSELHETIWRVVRAVPEAKYAVRFMGNAMSRVRIYPGISVSPSEPPVHVLDALDDPDLVAETGLTLQLALDAVAETERITGGTDGQSAMMRAFGENLTATGDSWLLGRAAGDDDVTMDDEVWQVYSTVALVTTREGEIRARATPRDDGYLVGPEDLLYRIWRPAAEFAGLADANMATVIPECEELLAIGRSMRAEAKSRNPAGLLLIPSELDPVARAPRAVPGANGAPPTASPVDQVPAETQWTKFESDLIRSLTTPIEDDGSAAAVVPHIIKGRGEILRDLRHVSLARTIDTTAIARVEALIRRIAHGVDLPVEVLTGVAEANHWTGWLIEDSTYKAHVEPTASIPASQLARLHLRPALLTWGHNPAVVRRITYGLDPSALVVRPNRTVDAREAYRDKAISVAAYLRYLGFAESDAPEDLELAKRYALERGIGGADLTAQIMNLLALIPVEPGAQRDEPIHLGPQIQAEYATPAAAPAADEPEPEPAPVDEPEPEPEPDDGGEDGGDPAPEAPDAPPEDGARAVVAAAAPLAGLGDALVSVEQRLRDRMVTLASEAMRRALDRAGSRLRGAVQGNPELRRLVNGVPAGDVGVILGEDRAPIDVDELLAGAFDDLQGPWLAGLAAAETAAVQLVGQQVGADAAVAAAGRTDREGDAARSWTALLAGLVALARTRVFAVAAAEPGEADVSVAVPAGIVRDALAVASGGRAGAVPAGLAAHSGPPGLFTGQRWREILVDLDVRADGWVWRAGFPSTPFLPHTSLSGATFDAWDDEVLANHSGWPGVSHYYPGDHRGCTCDAVPLFVTLNPRPQEG